MQTLLEAMVQPSAQNIHGDQPSHIAARSNRVDMLTVLAKYDKHMGRINKSHQTPLGVAKFHCCREAQLYLEEKFTHVGEDDSRNALGEIWWDRDIDMLTDGWRVEVGDRGQRIYINDYTGQRQGVPPKLSVDAIVQASSLNQLSMRKNIELVRDSDPLNKHDYKLEYIQEASEAAELIATHKAATVMQCLVRKRQAWKKYHKRYVQRQKKKVLAKFFKLYTPLFMAKKVQYRVRLLVRAQAVWRGYRLRKHFYGEVPEGQMNEYTERWWRRAKLQLRLKLWPLWRYYKSLKIALIARLSKRKPRTLKDWQRILEQLKKPLRVVGMYEEWNFPGFKKVYFYRHKLTGNCDLIKPMKMASLDNITWLESEQIRKNGCTNRQAALATKLQAMWRGYKTRSYYLFVEKAMEISLSAGEKYMANPGSLSEIRIICAVRKCNL